MSQAQAVAEQDAATKKKVALGLTAVFVVYFVSTISAQTLGNVGPRIAGDLNGMALYGWSLALPGLASAIVTLIFGKLSDMYGRRIVLIASLVFFILGSFLAAVASTFPIMIAARTVMALGVGALASLCFSVIGDLFPPAERAKWSGLLNIPAGIAALVGPTLGGFITETAGWRLLFWISVPLGIIGLVMVIMGVPKSEKRMKQKIDFAGMAILIAASASLIFAFSWAGTTYPWGSVQIIGLIAFSIIMWVVGFWYEGKVDEPIIEPAVLTNRTFLTAAVAGTLSLFGMMAIMAYYPIFLQGVQGATLTQSGQIITPFGVIMGFMGVPAGILIGRTKKYKWMFVVGYAILVVAMFGMWLFKETTPFWAGVAVTALAGLGLGSIPTANTLVAQFAVPRKYLGVAVGAIFFFVMMGMAVAPAVLSAGMSATYAKELAVQLPDGLDEYVSDATLASFNDPNMLVSAAGMAAVEAEFSAAGDAGVAAFEDTTAALKTSLAAGLKTVFLIGAILMVGSFLLIITIPVIPIDMEAMGPPPPPPDAEVPA